MDNANEVVPGAKFSERLVVFIQKNRIAIVSGSVAVFLAIAVVGGVYAFMEGAEKKAASVVEALSGRYEELRALGDEPARAEKGAALLADLLKAGKGKGFSGARALFIAGSYHADGKDWADAEKYWLEAAASAPKAYLAPIAIYNAASAAEERGDGKKALELYARCAAEYEESFPLVSRALFAVGRINEDMKDYGAANAAYRKIVDRSGGDGWTKLAHSRILSIAAKEGAN